MKKSVKQLFSTFLTLSLLLSCFTACQSDKTTKSSDNDNYNNNTIESVENGKNIDAQAVTLTEISSTGQISYDKFYNFGENLKHTDENLFPFIHSSKYGFADANGNVIIPEQYESVSLFSEGMAFVKSNDTWKVIDTDCNELFSFSAEYTPTEFKNGKAICTYTSYDSSSVNINVMVINSNLTTSQIKIPTASHVYYKVVNTPEFAGILINEAYGDNIEYRLLDLSGNIIWEFLSSYETLSPKIAQFEYNKALAPTYEFDVLDSFNIENGYMNIFNENFKWGLLDLSTGEIVLDCIYDYVGTYSDELCNVCSYGKWGYVDLNGNQVIEFSYSYTEKFVNGKALVKTQDNSFVIIDKSGATYFDCGVSFNYSTYTQCRYRIITDLQEKGIIFIRNYYNDECYLINIGNSTETIAVGVNGGITASQDKILVNKTMFSVT